VLVKSLEERKALELVPRLDVPIKVIIYLGTCIGACLASWSTARPERKREAGWSSPGMTFDLERANKKRRLGLNPTIPGAVAQGGPTVLDTRRRFRYYIPPDPEDLRNSKATKADDAEIPVHLWNDRLAYLVGALRLSEAQKRRLGFLGRCTHRYWIRRVREAWWTWWRENKSLLHLVEPKYWREIGRRGMAAVNYASLSSFWDWIWGPRLSSGVGSKSTNQKWPWVWPPVGWAPSPRR
jgi:hypothetical protein